MTLDDFATKVTGGWLFGYAAALERAGWRTTIVCVSSAVSDIRRMHHSSSATIVAVPQSKAHRLLRARIGDPKGQVWIGSPSHQDATALVQHLATPVHNIRRVLLEAKCSAILVQEYEYTRFDRLVRLGNKLRLPTFATFQGADFTASRLEAVVRTKSMAMASGLIVPAERERQRLSNDYGIANDKIAAVLNPLSLDTWHPEEKESARLSLGLPLDSGIVICHGRIDIRRKGLDILLEAWREAAGKVASPRTFLVLIGDGQDRAVLASMLAQPDLPDITWIDCFMTDRSLMRRWLSAADLFVSASRVEGMPVAPLEAMACGLPVVATAAHGIADIFPDGEGSGGIIVDVGDAGALAAAILRVLNDRDLRVSLSERARRRVTTHFSEEVVGSKLDGFLRRRMADEAV